jgi:hypothetical protein
VVGADEDATLDAVWLTDEPFFWLGPITVSTIVVW